MIARDSEAEITTLPGRRATQAALVETELMRAARDDPACFEPIYNCYFPRIYAYCLRRVGTPQEAEDLTSEVFIRALRGLDGYTGGHVAAWLFRIAHNAIANYQRDRCPAGGSEGAVPDEMPDPRPSPEECFAQAEERAQARALIASLSEKEQDIVNLRVYAGLTSAEIGATMGMRAGTVRMTLHRSLKKLGAHLSEELA